MELKSAISSVSLHAGKHLKASPSQMPQPVPFLLTGNTCSTSVCSLLSTFSSWDSIRFTFHYQFSTVILEELNKLGSKSLAGSDKIAFGEKIRAKGGFVWGEICWGSFAGVAFI